MTAKPNEWFALPYPEWAATKKTLQLHTQLLGKTKLALAPIDPHGAAWIEQMGEWVMPYQAALDSGDPGKAITDFLDRVYAIAVEYSGWDAEAFTYTKPPVPKRD